MSDALLEVGGWMLGRWEFTMGVVNGLFRRIGIADGDWGTDARIAQQAVGASHGG